MNTIESPLCHRIPTGVLLSGTAWLLLVGCGSLHATEPAAAPGPPPDAAEAAPEITAENLLENDRLWPFQVQLVDDWAPAGADRVIQKGAIGVLVRIQEGGIARVDFGRYGRHEVPIADTDVVKRANRVRTGDEIKMAPNFTLMIAGKLSDSAFERPRPFRYSSARDVRGALCVFADPQAEAFVEMAGALAPLYRREGVMTVFFPETDQGDTAVGNRLRALNWRVPFASHIYSQSFIRALLSPGSTMPWVILQTNDGRVIYQSAFRPEIVPTLTRAIDAHFSKARPQDVVDNEIGGWSVGKNR